MCVWMSIDNRMKVRRTLPPPRGDVEPVEPCIGRTGLTSVPHNVEGVSMTELAQAVICGVQGTSGTTWEKPKKRRSSLTTRDDL